jgi:hypothetical protein
MPTNEDDYDEDDEAIAERLENATPEEIEEIGNTPLDPETEKIMDEGIDEEMNALEAAILKALKENPAQ